MFGKIALVASLVCCSSALAREVVYTVDATNVSGVEYSDARDAPPNTVAVAISAYWTAGRQEPEKKVFYFIDGIVDNCTRLLHIALASTLSGSTEKLLKTVKLESGNKTIHESVVTACKMGTKI